MYEALVARVRYHIQKASFMGLKDAESTLLLAETADAIDELSIMVGGLNNALVETVNDGPRWISVKDKLPKKERREYWCYTDTGYQCMVRWTDDGYGLGSSDKWGWKIFDYPQYSKITHWMPLPEPPKEET